MGLCPGASCHASSAAAQVQRGGDCGAAVAVAAAADARDDYQNRGTATTAGRAGNQQRTTRGAIVPIERIARAASSCRLRRSGDRLISQSVARVESSVRQIRYSNHH